MAEGRGDAGGYLGWFFFGAVLGAGAALLLAPRTGRETRSLLAERGSEAMRRAGELANDAQGRAGEWIDRGREILGEQTERLRGAFEAGRDAMREEIRRSTTPP